MIMKRICVFCGARSGNRPEYQEGARALGTALAKRHIGLVYGGASIGLMGTLADAVLDAGGEVTGVMPHGLARKEIVHKNLTQFHEVRSMHERKALMERLSDGFIALPGGFGTFDETFEILTWAQLGLHPKPVGFLNLAGFYDPLFEMIDRTVDDGFVLEQHRGLYLIGTEPDDLISRMAEHNPPAPAVKWIARSET